MEKVKSAVINLFRIVFLIAAIIGIFIRNLIVQIGKAVVTSVKLTYSQAGHVVERFGPHDETTKQAKPQLANVIEMN